MTFGIESFALVMCAAVVLYLLGARDVSATHSMQREPGSTGDEQVGANDPAVSDGSAREAVRSPRRWQVPKHANESCSMRYGLLVVTATATAVVISACVWGYTHLPSGAELPVHWTLSGKADRFAPRDEALWTYALTVAALGAGGGAAFLGLGRNRLVAIGVIVLLVVVAWAAVASVRYGLRP
jgi:hypothetical protein